MVEGGPEEGIADPAAKQALLLREMNHRIKNLFSIVQGLIVVCRKSASSADELAADLRARLFALDAAHSLILVNDDKPSATLKGVVDAILAPYGGAVLPTHIDHHLVGPNALTSLALILHELATNAVKHGALSTREGMLDVRSEPAASGVDLVWFEFGARQQQSETEGFGTALQRAALAGLDARLERSWHPHGLEIRVSLPTDRLAA